MELQTTYERLRKREIQSPALKRPNQPQQSQDSSNNSPSLDQNRKLEHFQLLFPSGSESEEQSKYRYKSTSWVQLRALIYKNASIQAQQKGTNICQVLTPIICLVVVMLVKSLASANFQNTYAFEMEFPYFFNVPYHALYNTTPSPLEFSSCLQFYLYDFENATKKTQDFVLGTGKNGLLNKTIPSIKGSDNFYKCAEYDTVMPYFKKTENGSVNEQIYDNLLYLNNQTFTPRYDTPGLDILPDGAFTFYEANKYNLSVKIQINDLRLPEYHRGNGVSKFYVRELTLNNTQFRQRKIVTRVADGELIMIDLLSKAYIQKINSNVFLLSGSQYMPISTSDSAMLLKAIGIAGASLYPIALSLLLPVFLYTLVLEKEERLREMMKMNGLKIKNYWLVNYFWNLGLYLVSTFVFFLFGRVILRVPFFTDTSATILIPILFGWGLSQVSLSFFYQNFLSKTRTATILGYLLSIWTTIIAMTLNSGIYPTPQVLPTGFKLYPPFAFCRLIYILSLKCGGVGCVHKFSALTQEAIDCIQSLYFGAIVFLIFGLYLDAVLPQQYGVAEHPLFFLPKWLRSSKQAPSAKEPKTQHHHILEERDEDDGDMDVIIENELVKNMQPPLDKHPLIIKNLRKIYKAVGGRPPKVAVKNLSLHIKKGEMFGLLGPNGAGKTSLISMLTGLYPPEAGNAWVGGYNIIDEIEYVHTQMGVCPQFDLLWPNLTVEDHLLFYARIRGVPKREEKRVVEKAMAEVYLTRFTQFKVDQLSGGMKRRLSVAISLVGDPQIVFLDEPTTGLDPENRRRLWDILVEARGNRAIVLTTHSMEEADILCTRIGIITNGGLKCLGPQTRLKSRYGSGYHLSINCHREKFCTQNIENNSLNGSSNQPSQKVQSFMKMFLPKAILKSCFNGNLIYLVPLENLEISKIFQELEKRKPELGISDWGISQSTLEDVFMEVVNSSEEKGVNFKYKL